MTKNNRGRHNKGLNSGVRCVLPGHVGLNAQSGKLLDKWKKLTDADRANWGYDFQNYKDAHTSADKNK